MTESTPPTGPKPPPESQPPPAPQPIDPSDSKAAFLLKSPFAKMFEKTGATPTVKEMKAIINGILRQQIQEIKKSDDRWKQAMENLRKAIQGE